ncbi:MAG: low molecular weight protein-tyrosine-phosphatase [Opitutales bacterium]
MTTNSSSPYRVLFVCWGNICRSPAAECVFRSFVEKEGLSDRISCDSAGTIDQHHGNPPDRRMKEAAGRRNIVVEGAARMVTPPDFDRFDLLLAMDNVNLSELRFLVPNPDLAHKIHPFCDYLAEHVDTQIPDPFYGGARGFEIVLDLLEDGCGNLLTFIRNQIGV